MNIEILLDSDASAAEMAAIKAVASEEGIHGYVNATWSSRGLGDSPWVICLLVPIVIFFNAFISTVGKEAGRDAYQGLHRLITKLFRARRNSNGSVELWDKDTRTHVILTVDLPEEAYTQLAQLDLEQVLGGYWTWDSNEKQWTRL